MVTSANELRNSKVVELIKTKKGMKFSEIFEIFPPTTFCSEVGLHQWGFPKKIAKPDSIRILEVVKIAEYFKLPVADIAQIIFNDVNVK